MWFENHSELASKKKPEQKQTGSQSSKCRPTTEYTERNQVTKKKTNKLVVSKSLNLSDQSVVCVSNTCIFH